MRDYEEIFVQNSYQSYDWSMVAILQSGDEFAVYWDSGCSCNLPYEGEWYERLSWTKDLYEIGRQVRKSLRSMRGISESELAQGRANLHRLLAGLKKAERN